MRDDISSLPPKRRQVLQFIRAEIKANLGFPSREEIRAHMGWKNAGSATDVLMMLSGEGYITRWRENGRFRFGILE